MSKRKGVLIVIIVLVVLAAAVSVLAVLNRPGELPESGSVAVTSGGETLRVFTADELKALPYIEAQKEIVSSSFANDEGLFRGVPLRALLAEAGAPEGAQIVVRSEDGYVTAFPADEVYDSDNIFLAYSKDGEGLGSKDKNGTGPLRIVVTDDEFGTRCAKYVSEIEVR
ncbi:MAG: molybdopterin-dependent oxidoreductase [Oscillospiraceae bacterium]|nr:molybdopterin-dependent oxidoreductase [Oscillospiraceae bacterium]